MLTELYFFDCSTNTIVMHIFPQNKEDLEKLIKNMGKFVARHLQPFWNNTIPLEQTSQGIWPDQKPVVLAGGGPCVWWLDNGSRGPSLRLRRYDCFKMG